MVEIKRGEFDTPALAQLVGYMQELRSAYTNIRISGIGIGHTICGQALGFSRVIPSLELAHYGASFWVEQVFDRRTGDGHTSKGWLDPVISRPGPDFTTLNELSRYASKCLHELRQSRLPVLASDAPHHLRPDPDA